MLYRNDWTNQSCFLAWRLFCLSSKEIWVSPKIGVGLLLSGTLSQTPDFENFVTACRSRCQQNSSSSSSTVELVDDTYTTIDESWLFTTSRSTVTILLHYCRVLWICGIHIGEVCRAERAWGLSPRNPWSWKIFFLNGKCTWHLLYTVISYIIVSKFITFIIGQVC